MSGHFRYEVYLGIELSAAFVSQIEALLWAEHQYQACMAQLPADRPHKAIRVVDSQEDCIDEYYDCTDDSVANTIAAIEARPHGPGKMQYRVLTERECMTIRDTLEERAGRVEHASLEVLRTMIATSLNNDDATILASDLRHVMMKHVDLARQLRLLGEFIRRNHTVVHCHIFIPEL
jgi:hypothetical protein